MAQYSLASYFQNMKTIGNPLKAVDEENFKQLREIEEEIQEFAQKALAAGKPDEKVKIQVERDGKDVDLNIILGDRTTSLTETPTQVNNNIFLGGLKLNVIDREIQKRFRLSSDTTGILISDVEVKSKAEKAGFQAGDIIIQIEDIEIKSFANIETALKKHDNKFKRVYVNRYGQTILFIIQ